MLEIIALAVAVRVLQCLLLSSCLRFLSRALTHDGTYGGGATVAAAVFGGALDAADGCASMGVVFGSSLAGAADVDSAAAKTGFAAASGALASRVGLNSVATDGILATASTRGSASACDRLTR